MVGGPKMANSEGREGVVMGEPWVLRVNYKNNKNDKFLNHYQCIFKLISLLFKRGIPDSHSTL